MKSCYTTLLFMASGLPSLAQECANGRYMQADHFADVTVTPGVAFGSNVGVNGTVQALYMDVYEPTGDALAHRPVVLVAFGGSFISGTRADVAPFCTDLAKRGFVSVAYDYRVGFFFPNQTTTMRAVMRGAHDTRACVRYLRRSVAELGDPYHIDTTRIILGGVSAGAISALHAMYLDEDGEIPAQIAGELPGLGGLEGNSGSPGYSSDAMGCYSFSGCIGDTSWIDAGDQPLASVHEVGDNVVPYYTQAIYLAGFSTGLTASGSHDIHVRADQMGIVNCFKSYPGVDHVGYLGYDPIGSTDFISHFLGELVCGASVTCEGANTAVPELGEEILAPYPNPTNGRLQIDLRYAAELAVEDLSGRVVLVQRSSAGTTQLDLSGLPTGPYVVLLRGDSPRTFRVWKTD